MRYTHVGLVIIVAVLSVTAAAAAENVQELTPWGKLLFQDIGIGASYGHSNSVTIAETSTLPSVQVTTKEGPVSSFGFAIEKPFIAQILNVMQEESPRLLPVGVRLKDPINDPLSQKSTGPPLRDLLINRIYFKASWTYGDTVVIRRDTTRNDITNQTAYFVGVVYKVDLGIFARHICVFRIDQCAK